MQWHLIVMTSLEGKKSPTLKDTRSPKRFAVDLLPFR